MAEPIKIGNTDCEFLITTPNKPTTTAVIFLPGISGGAFSERFQPVVDACLGVGFSIVRISAWKNAEDVERKNLGDIFRAIGDVTTYLHQEGYTKIFGIGKSFGGAVMLALPSVHIRRKVLWAPAIGVADSGANIDSYMTANLGALHSLLDLKLDRALLQQKETPTLIIHGTADDNIPLSNSERIVSMLPNAKFLQIEGADHSYKNKEHETAVIKATIEFLTDQSTLLKP